MVPVKKAIFVLYKQLTSGPADATRAEALGISVFFVFKKNQIPGRYLLSVGAIPSMKFLGDPLATVGGIGLFQGLAPDTPPFVQGFPL